MQQATLASTFIGFSPRDLNPARKAFVNSQTLKEVVYWARFEGAQIRIDGETLYQGADFATDTNGADSSLAEIWAAWGERFLERLQAVLTGSKEFVILAYNGAGWSPVKSLPVL